jgi:hypothetical protein
MNPPNQPNDKTHKLVWIKVTNENAKKLDRIADSYCLTRASLCRLIVTQFLDDPTQKIHINNTNEHTEHNA